jgi:hypothetical protein
MAAGRDPAAPPAPAVAVLGPLPLLAAALPPRPACVLPLSAASAPARGRAPAPPLTAASSIAPLPLLAAAALAFAALPVAVLGLPAPGVAAGFAASPAGALVGPSLGVRSCRAPAAPLAAAGASLGPRLSGARVAMVQALVAPSAKPQSAAMHAPVG